MISISNNVSDETYPLLSGALKYSLTRRKRRRIRNSIAALVGLLLTWRAGGPIKYGMINLILRKANGIFQAQSHDSGGGGGGGVPLMNFHALQLKSARRYVA